MEIISDAQGQLIFESANNIIYFDFSHTPGQLTLQSVVESCRNSNSSKLLLLSLLPARMKRIQSQIKVLEC